MTNAETRQTLITLLSLLEHTLLFLQHIDFKLVLFTQSFFIHIHSVYFDEKLWKILNFLLKIVHSIAS